MVDRPWRGPVTTLAFGSLALQADLRKVDEADDYPDLSWPPASEPISYGRGRPTRKVTFWSAISKLSRPEARAVLYVIVDILTNRRKIRLATRGPGYLIERNYRFYSTNNDLSPGEARATLEFVMHQLRAGAVSVDELDASGIALRKVKQGRRRGQHWFLTESACRDAIHAKAHLEAHGIRRPASSRPMRELDDHAHLLKVVTAGTGWDTKTRRAGRAGRGEKLWWALCPVHDDHHPSLLLNPDGFAYCFSCKATGRWIDTEDPWEGPGHPPGQAPTHVYFRAHVAHGADHGHTHSSYRVEIADVLPSVLDLGLQSYSPQRAAMAGSPGVHPSQKYMGHWSGQREWSSKGATTALFIRDEGAPESSARLYRPAKSSGLVYGKLGSRGMMQSYATNNDLIEVMRTAEKRSKWKKTVEKAERDYTYAVRRRGLDHRKRLQSDDLPDLFVSLDHQSHTELIHGGRETYLPSRGLQPPAVLTMAFPTGFVPSSTRWVGIDVDKITIPMTLLDSMVGDDRDAMALLDQRGGAGCVGDQVIAAAAEEIRAILDRHPDFTGRMAVVRTGPVGVQLVAELENSRWDPEKLWTDDFKTQIRNLSRLVMRALHGKGCAGGSVDQTSMKAGRYFRRPGWRIAKTGDLFRSRLVFATP